MKKIIFYLGIFSFLFIFISCKNFLNGSDLVQELDETIAYNNAEECSLYIKSQDGTGYFLNEGEIKLKVGYSVDLQFTVNSKYIFNNLIAVSSNDNSESRNDYIHFNLINSDEAKGVYTVQAKLLKPATDILITADCFLIPEIISAEPNSVNISVPQDTSIVIKFNKPIEPNLFINEEGQLNYNSIKIYTDETNLLDASNTIYFDKPYFSDENTTLTIPTVKSLFIIPIGSSETKVINVSINWNGLVSETNQKTYTVNYSFAYSINSSKDTNPPVITELYATPTLDTSKAYYRKLSDLEYSDWDKNDPTGTYRYGTFSQNHVSKLYFTFKGYDKDSGIKCIKTQEIFEFDAEGNELNNADEKLFSYPSDSSYFIQTEDGQQKVTFEYNFTHPDNGLIKIKLFIYDYADNFVEKDFEVIFQNNFSPIIRAEGDTKRIVHAYNEDGSKKNSIPAPNFTRITQSASVKLYKNFVSYGNYTLYLTDKNSKIKLFMTEDSVIMDASIQALTDINNAINNQTINPFIDNYYVLEIEEKETGIIAQYEYLIPKAVDLYFYSGGLVPTTDVSQSTLDAYAYYTFESAEDASKSRNELVTLTSKLDPETRERVSRSDGKYNITINWPTHGKGTFTFYVADYNIFVGAIGKPIKYYYDIENPNEIKNLAPSDFPEFTVTDMGIYEKNSSKLHFRVDFTDPHDEYNYLIKYEYRNDADFSKALKVCYTKEKEITVSNFGTCTFCLVAIDQNGNFAGQSSKTNIKLNIPDLTAPYLSIILDNQKGKETYINTNITRYNVYVDSTKSMYGLKPYDLTLSNGKHNDLQYINYYLIPLTNASSLQLTEEALAPYKEYKYDFSEHLYDTDTHHYYDLDTSELINGRYMFFAKAKDGNGNVSISKCNNPSGYFYNYVSSEAVDIAVNDDKTEVHIKCKNDFIYYFNTTEGWSETIYYADKLRCILEVQYYDIASNKWKTLDSQTIKNKEILKIDYNANETKLKNNYIRAFARIEEPYGDNESYYNYTKNLFLKTSYYCPSYLINNLTIDNKNIQEGLLGYQINCDQPTLVHIMYNNRKLTGTTTPEDVSLWETKGKELGTVIKSSTFTYSPDAYNVPKNAWYTTIVHFADGKTWMSEPKQK